MVIRIFVLLVLLPIVFSCHSNYTDRKAVEEENKAVHKRKGAPAMPPDTVKGNKEQYANIIHVLQIGDTTFLDADYIQLLTGKAAINAAKKAGVADTIKTRDSAAYIYVPNDYFILNESRKTRQLPLASQCVFELLINPYRVHPIEDHTLESFKRIYKDSPFILTLDKNGRVVKIKEVYLP